MFCFLPSSPPPSLPHAPCHPSPPSLLTLLVLSFSFVLSLSLQVISSVKDQDNYVGFVGVQEEKERQERNPSPNPPTISPPSYVPSGKPPKPALPATPRVPKPDAPAPSPDMKIGSRTSSLSKKQDLDEFKKVQVSSGRPPKPSQAPPSLHAKEQLKHSKSYEGELKSKKNDSPSKVSEWRRRLICPTSSGML